MGEAIYEPIATSATATRWTTNTPLDSIRTVDGFDLPAFSSNAWTRTGEL
jgi:hypothetical protein